MDNKNELYHYGVKGMKWGVVRGPRVAVAAGRTIARGVSKKLPYITVIQGRDNAKKAAKEAKKDTINKINNSPYKKYIKKNTLIRDAEKKARKESFAADKAKNKELREERKADKANKPKMSTKQKVAVGATVTATILAGAFAAKKISDIHAFKPLSESELSKMGLTRL